MNIYVGNLHRNITEAELREAFEAFGTVSSAAIIKDKFSGESRGFGFVEMPDQTEAREAISGLNDHDLGGSTLIVNEARPREERSKGGYGQRGGHNQRGGYGQRGDHGQRGGYGQKRGGGGGGGRRPQ